MKREPWYRFFGSEGLEESDGMDANTGFKFFRDTCYALVRGERGKTTLADKMLARQSADSENKRKAALAKLAKEKAEREALARAAGGKSGGADDWGGIIPDDDAPVSTSPQPQATPNTSLQMLADAGGCTQPQDDKIIVPIGRKEIESETKIPPPAAGGGRDGEAVRTMTATPGTAQAWQFSGDKSQIQSRTIGDSIGTLVTPGQPKTDKQLLEEAKRKPPKQAVNDIPPRLVPQFMVHYCGDENEAWALGAYNKRCRALGPQRFKDISFMFVSDTESGEEPRNRGAAFTAKLDEAIGRRTVAV